MAEVGTIGEAIENEERIGLRNERGRGEEQRRR